MTINESIKIEATLDASKLTSSIRAIRNATNGMAKNFDKVTASVSKLNVNLATTAGLTKSLVKEMNSISKIDIKKTNREILKTAANLRKTVIAAKRLNREVDRFDKNKIDETTNSYYKMTAGINAAVKSMKALVAESNKLQKIDIRFSSNSAGSTRSTSSSSSSSSSSSQSGVQSGAMSAASVSAITSAIRDAVTQCCKDDKSSLTPAAISGAIVLGTNAIIPAIVAKGASSLLSGIESSISGIDQLISRGSSWNNLEGTEAFKLPDFSETVLPDSHLPDWSGLSAKGMDESAFNAQTAQMNTTANDIKIEQLTQSVANYSTAIDKAKKDLKSLEAVLVKLTQTNTSGLKINVAERDIDRQKASIDRLSQTRMGKTRRDVRNFRPQLLRQRWRRNWRSARHHRKIGLPK